MLQYMTQVMDSPADSVRLFSGRTGGLKSTNIKNFCFWPSPISALPTADTGKKNQDGKGRRKDVHKNTKGRRDHDLILLEIIYSSISLCFNTFEPGRNVQLRIHVTSFYDPLPGRPWNVGTSPYQTWGKINSLGCAESTKQNWSSAGFCANLLRFIPKVWCRFASQPERHLFPCSFKNQQCRK